MANLGVQLKGVNWKDFFINHCEKLVLVVVGLFVLTSLGTTRWKSYPTQPEEIDEKVNASKAAYMASRWPEENKKDFEARDLGDVVAGVTQEIPPRPNDIYTLGTSWVRPIYPPKLKRGEVNWLNLEEPIADPGKVLLAFIPTSPVGESGQPLIGVEGATPDQNRANSDLDDDSKPRGVDGPRNAPNLNQSPTPMPLVTPGGGHSAGGGGQGKPKKNSAAGGGHAAGMDLSLMPSAGADGMMMPGAGGQVRNVEAKGYRFVSVRAVFPLKHQLEEIRKTLQLETTTQAWDQLRFSDFKIQRQTALAGENPWAGNWEDIDIQTAIDILSRVDFDVDVVEEKYRDPVITMPLPFRETGNWRAHASHPRIKKLLTDEEAARQEAINRAAIETADKLKLKQGGAGGGFNRLQHNTRDLQRQIMGNSSASSTFNEIYSSQSGMMGGAMMPGMSAAGMGGGHGGSPSGGMAMPTSGGGGHGAMPGMIGGGVGGASGVGMGGMGMGSGVVAAAVSIPEVLLFRYLDFDVIPGNAYRYRVQLVVKNPNFGAEAIDLKDPSSANGENREGKFSPPTNPVVIEDELKIFISKINTPTTGNTADMEVFQWLTDSGSYVMAPFVKLARGDQLAALTGTDSKTGDKTGGVEVELLRPANLTFKKERIDFETPNVLLNMAVSSVVSPEDNPDLGLPSKRIPVKLEEVVMVNRFGEIVDVDSSSQKLNQVAAVQRIKSQEQAFSYLKVAAPTASGGGLEGYLSGMMPPGGAEGMVPGAKGGKMSKRTGSALKRGSMSNSGYPGMAPGGAGFTN